MIAAFSYGLVLPTSPPVAIMQPASLQQAAVSRAMLPETSSIFPTTMIAEVSAAKAKIEAARAAQAAKQSAYQSTQPELSKLEEDSNIYAKQDTAKDLLPTKKKQSSAQLNQQRIMKKQARAEEMRRAEKAAEAAAKAAEPPPSFGLPSLPKLPF